MRALAICLKRPYTSLVRRARKLGLTNGNRTVTEKIKKSLSTKRLNGSWKAGWRVIGGQKKYYRSRWEANYARYLEYLKNNGHIKEWLHEPETFWFERIKRGCRSYLPDFKVIKLDGTHYWVEVKGWMDDRSKTKIKRFKKYYPKEEFLLIDAKWYRKNSKTISILCPEWEDPKTVIQVEEINGIM